MSDSRLVDSGGRVKVLTRMSSSEDSSQTALSILSIDNVHLRDRGNYTCKPASGGQASISLHVLEGRVISGVVRGYEVEEEGPWRTKTKIHKETPRKQGT